MGRKIVGFAGFVLALCAFTRNGAFSSEPAASACLPLPDDGPWAAVEELFRFQDAKAISTDSKKTELPSCEAGPKKLSLPCVPEQAGLEFLVAAVADPSETHLALNTDRGLESLMWAIGDAGYSFERYWLPWPIGAESAGTTVSDQRCRKVLKDNRESEPGLLIFRRNRAPGDSSSDGFLFVFVVGETPTSGIRQSGLSKAVEYMRALSPSTTDIRLLGPNFSGSLRPLRTHLKELQTKYPSLRFHAVSGTASNVDAIREFKAGLPQVNYESAVENDARAAKLFFDYIRSQSESTWFAGEIAVLSEDETVYGSGDIRHSVSDGLSSNELSHDWLMLRYPREIARLRNAYSAEASLLSHTKQETPAQNALPHAPRDAPAPGEANTQTDSAPTFSQQESPASQQAALLAIASSLRREKASYAGIVATDILDSLFLARFLRLSDPDIRIFALDADLLFLRESEKTPMTGLLAVTNYPLFSRDQHWTAPEVKDVMPRRIQFSSRYAQGIYNAARRLIEPVSLPANGGAVERYLEYQNPFDRQSAVPPLWLTVLGRDGYWPVALLDEPDRNYRELSTLTPFEPAPAPPQTTKVDTSADASTKLLTHERLHPEPPSKGWSLFFMLACLFCFLHVVYVCSILTKPDQSDRLHLLFRALGRLFAAYPAARPLPSERPFLLSATVSLFSSLLVVSLPLCRFLDFDWARFYFPIASVCLVSLFMLALVLSFDRLVYPRIFVLTWLLAVVFPALWGYLILRDDYNAGIFLAYRALYLGSGVSPGIPIALLSAAFYGWAWVHLKQESASAKRNTARAHGEFHYLDRFQKLMWNTDDAVGLIMDKGISAPALVVVLLWFLVLWPPISVRTFESYWYDVLYIFVLIVLYWSIALIWIQCIRCWRRFSELLQALERHPIRRAFSRLPKEISWIPLVSVSRPRNLFVTSRTCECLRAILTNLEEQHLSPFLRGILEPLCRDAVRDLGTLECNVKNEEEADPEVYAQLQLSLDTAASFIVSDLTACRWAQGESQSLADLEEGKGADSKVTPGEEIAILEEEFVALRFLMFIRYIIRHLRNWVGFIITGFIVSIISLNSYPFQARRWIGFASVIMLIGLGAGMAYVFAEMDKDAILSRITDTKKNEVGKTFFFRLAKYGGLPVLTVLGAQFPSVGQYLFSWLQPALEALK